MSETIATNSVSYNLRNKEDDMVEMEKFRLASEEYIKLKAILEEEGRGVFTDAIAELRKKIVPRNRVEDAIIVNDIRIDFYRRMGCRWYIK